MDELADSMALLLERVAPAAFTNLTLFSKEAGHCRIGRLGDKRPFSGVTSVVDFCAHSHHDRNNINGGCTMVRPCIDI
jgi:methylcytosine dioxygenase